MYQIVEIFQRKTSKNLAGGARRKYQIKLSAPANNYVILINNAQTEFQP